MLTILMAGLLLIKAEQAYPEIETTVPVSAEVGTSIARSLFPVGVDLSKFKLFLTEPSLIFIDPQRLGMQVRLQAYDHRPAEGIAESEMGRALFSGQLGFDPNSRQILLHEPGIEKLEFDRETAASRLFYSALIGAWSEQVTDPMRFEIPPHPYVLPFKDNIRNLSYDGKSINIGIRYQ